MLLAFTCDNFRSIRYPATLSMRAAAVPGNRQQTIRIGKPELRIQPVALIHGERGSGKSNLFKAQLYMKQQVLESLSAPLHRREELVSTEQQAWGRSTRQVHVSADNIGYAAGGADLRPSTFQLHFTIPGDQLPVVYDYGFSTREGVIQREWLRRKAPSMRNNAYFTLFRRNLREDGGYDFEWHTLSDLQIHNLEHTLTPTTLIVTLGAMLGIDFCREVYEWWGKTEFIDYVTLMHMENRSRWIPRNLVDFRARIPGLLRWLRAYDPSITEIEVRPIHPDEIRAGQHYQILLGHRVSRQAVMHYIDLDLEANSLQLLLALYFPIRRILDIGGLLVLDELDEALHPQFMAYMITLFLEPSMNPNRAQLVFNTTMPWDPEQSLLYPDACWTAMINRRRETQLLQISEAQPEMVSRPAPDRLKASRERRESAGIRQSAFEQRNFWQSLQDRHTDS